MHVIRLLLLFTTARAAKVAPLPLADYTAYVRGVFEKLESGGWNESSRPSVSPCVKINQCVGCTR